MSTVLIVNGGSQTVKYTFFQKKHRVLKVIYHHDGRKYFLTVKKGGRRREENIMRKSYEFSFRDLLDLKEVKLILKESPLSAIGFRVVHGGEFFKESVKVTKSVMKKLKGLDSLAPLHNPFARQLISQTERSLPKVTKVLVFDTAFHSEIEEHNWRYAIPLKVADANNFRRYGFHGIAVESVVQQLKYRKKLPEHLIACHLGGGCSVTAVKHGKSVDTSMGMTPLEGLVMGTRCGDIDPGIILDLKKKLRLSDDGLRRILNHESGLEGLCGTADMREIVARSKKRDKRARMALEIFCIRAAKKIASMMVTLGGLDGLVFSGGIGENQPLVRQKICEYLGPIGVRIHHRKNNHIRHHKKGLQKWYSTCKIYVVKVDEAEVIRMEVEKMI